MFVVTRSDRLRMMLEIGKDRPFNRDYCLVLSDVLDDTGEHDAAGKVRKFAEEEHRPYDFSETWKELTWFGNTNNNESVINPPDKGGLEPALWSFLRSGYHRTEYKADRSYPIGRDRDAAYHLAMADLWQAFLTWVSKGCPTDGAGVTT